MRNQALRKEELCTLEGSAHPWSLHHVPVHAPGGGRRGRVSSFTSCVTNGVHTSDGALMHVSLGLQERVAAAAPTTQ